MNRHSSHDEQVEGLSELEFEFFELCLELLRRELEDYVPYRTLDEVEKPLSAHVARATFWLLNNAGELPDEKRTEAIALLKRFAAEHPSERVRDECARFRKSEYP